MKIKLIFTLLIIVFLTVSCEKKEFIVLIEQPTDKKLNNVELILNLDENDKINHNYILKYTEVSPNFITVVFPVVTEQKHILKARLLNKNFVFDLVYPKDKYVIISPYYKKDGVKIGIVKKKNEFILQ